MRGGGPKGGPRLAAEVQPAGPGPDQIALQIYDSGRLRSGHLAPIGIPPTPAVSPRRLSEREQPIAMQDTASLDSAELLGADLTREFKKRSRQAHRYDVGGH